MMDLFMESIALQRIELVTRLVVKGTCDMEDKELALGWLAELTAELVARLDQLESENPRRGGSNSGSLLQ